MGANTKIEWADHTLNWWTGCEPVSPGCAHCYAESWAKRAGRNFGERRLTSAAIHALPQKWQREAASFRVQHGRRQRVFVNSLSDWADNQVPVQYRTSLLAAIALAPDVDFLLLTKRIGNVKRWLDAGQITLPPNVWIGISVVDQAELDRDLLKLLTIPAPVRFLSIEPMLAPISFADRVTNIDPRKPRVYESVLKLLDWVIVGGESGTGARPFNLHWARTIIAQCDAAGTACFIKQLGANPIYAAGGSIESEGEGFRLSVASIEVETDIELNDRKGGDWTEWPPDLRIREFPRGAR